jgi:hypothetical protein
MEFPEIDLRGMLGSEIPIAEIFDNSTLAASLAMSRHSHVPVASLLNTAMLDGMLARLDWYTCWETLRCSWCPSPALGTTDLTGAGVSGKFNDAFLRD